MSLSNDGTTPRPEALIWMAKLLVSNRRTPEPGQFSEPRFRSLHTVVRMSQLGRTLWTPIISHRVFQYCSSSGFNSFSRHAINIDSALVRLGKLLHRRYSLKDGVCSLVNLFK